LASGGPAEPKPLQPRQDFCGNIQQLCERVDAGLDVFIGVRLVGKLPAFIMSGSWAP
jgi:hypothetical protein